MLKDFTKKVFFLFLILVMLGVAFFVRAESNANPSSIDIAQATILGVPDKFVVPLGATLDQVADSLMAMNYIKDKASFITLFSKTKGDIAPGAYKISPGIALEKVVTALHGKPYMKWVKITPGLRKEEIADLLALNLGWTKTQKSKWINSYTKMKYDYVEGVYFPDTYLIPVSETPLAVANRLTAKFNEKFAAYLPLFKEKNMLWTKGLTLASIVQREAANDADMSLIAGILLNRLNQKMPLSVDATLQYVRGNKGAGYWAPIILADKKTDSAYNTYKKAGLPPHPISNPGTAAIEAVLNPAPTDCLYYLHDKDRITHCAKTYEEHQANIVKYLK